MTIRRMAIRAGATTFGATGHRELSDYIAGVPFLLAAATPGLAFHPGAVLAGFVLAMLAFFTVQLPVAAALLAPSGSEATEFPLSGRVYLVLLAVWTGTAWLATAASY